MTGLFSARDWRGAINVPGTINLRSLNFSVTDYTLNGAGSLNFTTAGTSTVAGATINVTAAQRRLTPTSKATLFGFSKIGAGNLVVSNVGNGILGGTLAIFNSDFGTRIIFTLAAWLVVRPMRHDGNGQFLCPADNDDRRLGAGNADHQCQCTVYHPRDWSFRIRTRRWHDRASECNRRRHFDGQRINQCRWQCHRIR